MNLRQAAQQALEALESDPDAMVEVTECHWDYKRDLAITALRAALAEPENQSQSQIDTKVNPAEPEPKPVAWMCPDDPDRATAFAWRYGYCIDCGKPRIPVYTAATGETK